jgi:enamine deaminase RidA (YjgF/YER057c/UK114 family)
MTQTIQRHHTSARMSKAVKFGDLIFLCGQTSSGMPFADVASQTREVLGRIDALLAEVGSDRSRILSAIIHLKSMADFATMNECWESWLAGSPAPARTTVEAALAADSLLVEITITAAT